MENSNHIFLIMVFELFFIESYISLLTSSIMVYHYINYKINKEDIKLIGHEPNKFIFILQLGLLICFGTISCIIPFVFNTTIGILFIVLLLLVTFLTVIIVQNEVINNNIEEINYSYRYVAVKFKSEVFTFIFSPFYNINILFLYIFLLFIGYFLK